MSLILATSVIVDDSPVSFPDDCGDTGIPASSSSRRSERIGYTWDVGLLVIVLFALCSRLCSRLSLRRERSVAEASVKGGNNGVDVGVCPCRLSIELDGAEEEEGCASMEIETDGETEGARRLL